MTSGYRNGVTKLDIAFDGTSAKPYTFELQDSQGKIELKVPQFKIWSLEQPSLHTVTVSSKDDAVLNNPRFVGIALWQMFDTRSYIHVGSVRTKPFGLNLAGLLDPYRSPKLAYTTVPEICHKHLSR